MELSAITGASKAAFEAIRGIFFNGTGACCTRNKSKDQCLDVAGGKEWMRIK